MPNVTLKQVAAIAAQLGHSDLSVRETRSGRWIASCSCGYESTSRLNRRFGADAAAHHLEEIVRAWQASGAPLPTRRSEDAFESHPNSVAS